jgi:hypothetical protein
MVQEYEPQHRAQGQIQICIERLIDEYPFHARILERFRIVSRPEVGTMAVTVSGTDVLLLHNPDFVLNTPSEELTGALLHEVHHVLFNHVLADPADYPDEWARTVAEEVTANEFIQQPLPGEPIRLEQFPSLPPMESTDERYARLKRRVSRMPIATPQDSLASAVQGGSATKQQGSTDAKKQDGADAEKQDGGDAEKRDGADAEKPDGTDAEKQDGASAKKQHSASAKKQRGASAKKQHGAGAAQQGNSGAAQQGNSGPPRVGGGQKLDHSGGHFSATFQPANKT